MRARHETRAWLDPVWDALDAVDVAVPFFFRNDDVGWADDRLFPLLDLFAARSLPIDLAVIPAALSDALGKRLSDRCAAANGGLRVHQHGWRHVNHESEGRHYEFGPSRAAVDQAADLRAGRSRLQAALGAFMDPIFTPPWNRCGQATVALLAAEYYCALSRDAGARRLQTDGLVEIPVSIDWQRRAQQADWTADLARDIRHAAADGRPVGIMLHHAVMNERCRTVLGELLDLLARHDNADCDSMMGCATGNLKSS